MKRSSKSGRETPPLTRGRLIDTSIGWKVLRNTPAYAGKTQCSIHPVKRRGKHPRLRGEDTPNCREARLPLETPPLTRGRRLKKAKPGVRHGNTPAYAGKTGRRRWFFFRSETPPLTRGRQNRNDCNSQTDGNTPAYAGKTAQFGDFTSGYEKHPRLRGEDPTLGKRRTQPSETPPLTRGRRRERGIRRGGGGNTPAYAGKTQ